MGTHVTSMSCIIIYILQQVLPSILPKEIAAFLIYKYRLLQFVIILHIYNMVVFKVNGLYSVSYLTQLDAKTWGFFFFYFL